MTPTDLHHRFNVCPFERPFEVILVIVAHILSEMALLCLEANEYHRFEINLFIGCHECLCKDYRGTIFFKAALRSTKLVEEC